MYALPAASHRIVRSVATIKMPTSPPPFKISSRTLPNFLRLVKCRHFKTFLLASIILSAGFLFVLLFIMLNDEEASNTIKKNSNLNQPRAHLSTTKPIKIDNDEHAEFQLKSGQNQLKKSKMNFAGGRRVKKKKPLKKTTTTTLRTTHFNDDDDELTTPNHFLSYSSTCPVIKQARNDFDSVKVYPSLKFEEQSIWDNTLERRYLEDSKSRQFPLKVIVVPHSHNDPGWGWTLSDYYNRISKNILNFLVEKMTENKNMTFLWSEVSFLNIWWKSASLKDKNLFRELVKEGRLELTTGGWVMTDEAVVHLYSMISQLIEGQEWIKYNIGVLPTNAWSVDPFGFSSVMPYILKSSQMESMLILRIHYAWKKWLAHKQFGDFRWGQRWDDNEDNSILCHQHPYTMYTMTASLGPDSAASYRFNFINSELEQINSENVATYAKLFLEQGGRTGSLTSHNVVLAILGDDFRFRNASEWDNSYSSFMQLFEEINTKPTLYGNAHAEFGTVKTFFKAVRERKSESEFPLFNGDFFVYSDEISNEGGRGAYWSGFYASRPFWKQLYRDAEANLRAAEILFTFARMISKQSEISDISCLNKNSESQIYKRLQIARRHLALFAHHDGAPGVSTPDVMNDFGLKLNEVLIHSTNIQLTTIACLLRFQGISSKAASQISSSLTFPNFKMIGRGQIALNFTSPSPPDITANSEEAKKAEVEDDEILEDLEDENPDVGQDDEDYVEKNLVVFNSLSFSKVYLISVPVTSVNVQVFGPKGELIPSQLNPSLSKHKKFGIILSTKIFELVWYYKLEAVSITKFKVVAYPKDKVNGQELAVKAKVHVRYVNSTSRDQFEMIKIGKDENFTISNQKYQLHFNSTTGLLTDITLKNKMTNIPAKLKFGGYSPMPDHSGPYLFMPKDEFKEISKKNPFSLDTKLILLLVDGPLETKHHVTINAYHHIVKLHKSPVASELNDGIFIQNMVHVEGYKGEYFMRVDTDLSNNYGGTTENETVLYTDQSGFTFEKRVTVRSIGLEGNTYPITTMGYIQDGVGRTGHGNRKLRLSLLVDRAHGISSFIAGRLELLIERRTPYNDNRGIEQGLLDNRFTMSNYVLHVEDITANAANKHDYDDYQSGLPTLEAHHLSQRLNYPLQMFYLNSKKPDPTNYDDDDDVENGENEETDDNNLDNFSSISFFSEPLPSDTHLLLMRTSPTENNLNSPSAGTSLMTLQKFGYFCNDKLNDNDEEVNKSSSNFLGYSNPANYFHTNIASGTSNNWHFLNSHARVKIDKVDLTGLRPKSKSSSQDDNDENMFKSSPFEISSFLLHFFSR